MTVRMVLSDPGLIGTVGLSKEYFITFTGIAVQAQNPQP